MRRRIVTISAMIALGLTWFGISAWTMARATEIKLLSAVALHPAIDALIPDLKILRDTRYLLPTERRAVSRNVFKRGSPSTS